MTMLNEARTIKVSISTPARERALNDEAARAHHMNRSEFYTRAAAQLRDQEQEGVAEINDMVARFGQRDAAEVRAEANRVLEDVIW